MMSLKTLDWDDEEDGEWEAPKNDNPMCEATPRCGGWKRPTKINEGTVAIIPLFEMIGKGT